MHDQRSERRSGACIEYIKVARLADLEAADGVFEGLQILRKIKAHKAQADHSPLGVLDRVILGHVLVSEQGSQSGVTRAFHGSGVAGVGPVQQSPNGPFVLVGFERGGHTDKVIAGLRKHCGNGAGGLGELVYQRKIQIQAFAIKAEIRCRLPLDVDGGGFERNRAVQP